MNVSIAIETLIEQALREVFTKRFAGRSMPYEAARELFLLENQAKEHVASTLARSIQAAETSKAKAAEAAKEALEKIAAEDGVRALAEDVTPVDAPMAFDRGSGLAADDVLGSANPWVKK